MTLSKRLYQVSAWVALASVPALTIFFVMLNSVNHDLYVSLSKEDHLVEWLTVLFLLIASIISLAVVIRVRREQLHNHWFFLVFAALCLFIAFEEISWGQRILGLTTPDYFVRNNVQREFNFHNLVIGIAPKEAFSAAALAYGVLLPTLALNRSVRSFLVTRRVVIPSMFLSLGFLVAAELLFVDKPVGLEEEIGEMFIGISFGLIALMEYLKLDFIKGTPSNIANADAAGLDQSVLGQLDSFSPTLVNVFLPSFLLALMAYVLLPFQFGIPVRNFTRNPESLVNPTPLISLLLLGTAAALCYFSVVALRKKGKSIELTVYFLIAGLLTSSLLLDHLFVVHERLIPQAMRTDEKMVLFGYVIIVALFAVRFRKIILKTDLILLVITAGFVIASLYFDVAPEENFLQEDRFKLAGTVGWLVYWLRTSYLAIDTDWLESATQDAAATDSKDRLWLWARAIAAGGIALWLALSLGNVWLAPRLEARYMAEPTRVEWFDGAISLVGYHTSHDAVIESGDRLTVKLYWVTSQNIPADYSLSVHLLSQAEAKSIVSQDRPMGGLVGWSGWGPYLTTSWLPGVVTRDVVRLQIPNDLPLGDNYWFIVRIWRPDGIGGRWETGERVIITSADRELFEPITLILFELQLVSGLRR